MAEPDQQKSSDLPKRVSLHPLSPEEALGAPIQVSPFDQQVNDDEVEDDRDRESAGGILQV